MRLLSPKGQTSRPITDRVKESLFNVLYNYGLPQGAVVADLFCGVGSLGLEALSRGAAYVVFVEQDRQVAATLERNIEKAGFVEESKVIKADAFKIGAPPAAVAARISNLESRISNVQKYDLVFVDPPYVLTEDVGSGSPLFGLLDLLQEQVADAGYVVVRTERRMKLLDESGRLKVIERRQWGTMAVTILGKK